MIIKWYVQDSTGTYIESETTNHKIVIIYIIKSFFHETLSVNSNKIMTMQICMQYIGPITG